MSDQPVTQPTVPTDPMTPVASTSTPDPADLSAVSQGMLGQQPAPQPISGSRRRELGTPMPGEVAPTAPETSSPPEQQPQAPETERSAELSPELEKFVEQVEKQKQAALETVVSAETMPSNLPKTVSKPVIVLPLTQKLMKQGQSKKPTLSIRWLAEWCVRQIKRFRNILVVYRENE